jgi:glycerol-3-phosphate acyltransferase PlsY
MTGRGILWVLAGYLAGTLPSTWLVAKAARAGQVQSEARRRAGEADPHVLITKYLDWKWAALASTADVLKGFLFILVAREAGHLTDAWLAAAAVAVVLGHTFPPYLTRWAGRGLAASAGVLLILLPVEMVIAGLLYLLGALLRASGLFSTIGFASIPVTAAIRGQPAAFVVMGVVIVAILVARRLEGVTGVVRSGVPWPRAILYRAVFDASSRPNAHGTRRPSVDPATDQ